MMFRTAFPLFELAKGHALLRRRSESSRSPVEVVPVQVLAGIAAKRQRSVPAL